MDVWLNARWLAFHTLKVKRTWILWLQCTVSDVSFPTGVFKKKNLVLYKQSVSDGVLSLLCSQVGRVLGSDHVGFIS